ncbi:MAG: undecaprenyl-diphosphate phosphatase [Clostridia bacterium]|nr:undecaprenyl-diphosphate phosphatase [Clostridia bacterium]
MNYLYSIVLGLIEALGEALPVAGSGLLLIAKRLTPLPEEMIRNANMDAALRWGVLLAVVLVFHKTFLQVLKGIGGMVTGLFKGTFKWRKASRYQMIAVYLLLTTLPMVILAFIQQYYNVLGRWADNLLFVGAMLLVSGGLVFIGSHSIYRGWSVQDMKAGHAFKLGLFQAVACLPGLSRTATTLSMVRNMGFDRQTAEELSFMMLIPTLLGTNLMRMGALSLPSADWGVLLTAFGAALLFGIGAFALVKYLVRKDRYGFTTFYCLVAGVAAIVLHFAL